MNTTQKYTHAVPGRHFRKPLRVRTLHLVRRALEGWKASFRCFASLTAELGFRDGFREWRESRAELSLRLRHRWTDQYPVDHRDRK